MRSAASDCIKGSRSRSVSGVQRLDLLRRRRVGRTLGCMERLAGQFAEGIVRMWCWIWAAARGGTPWRARSYGHSPCCSRLRRGVRYARSVLPRAASAVGVDNAVFLMNGVPSFEEHPEQTHASRASEAGSPVRARPPRSTCRPCSPSESAGAAHEPTPFPKRRKHLRLAMDHLMGYRPLLRQRARASRFAHRQPTVTIFLTAA